MHWTRDIYLNWGSWMVIIHEEDAYLRRCHYVCFFPWDVHIFKVIERVCSVELVVTELLKTMCLSVFRNVLPINADNSYALITVEFGVLEQRIGLRKLLYIRGSSKVAYIEIQPKTIKWYDREGSLEPSTGVTCVISYSWTIKTSQWGRIHLGFSVQENKRAED